MAWQDETVGGWAGFYTPLWIMVGIAGLILLLLLGFLVGRCCRGGGAGCCGANNPPKTRCKKAVAADLNL